MWTAVWSFLTTLAINIAIGIAISAISLKREKRTKYTLSDFTYPTTDQNRALIRVFGAVPVAGSLNWWGNYRARDVRRKVRTFGVVIGSRSSGFEHYVSLWLSLAGHPVQRVKAVYYGKKKVWSGSLELSRTGPTELAVDLRWADQEGQEIPGGLAGTFRFWNLERKIGDTTPLPVDTQLAGWLGENPPMYPNTCHAVFDGFVGISTSMNEIRIVLEDHTVPAALFEAGDRIVHSPITGLPGKLADFMAAGAFDAWIEEFRQTDGGANIAFVAAEVLTRPDPAFGARLSPYLLDFDSFMQAAKRTHYQGLGVDYAWETTSSSDEQLKKLMQLANANLDVSPYTGLLDMHVISESDSDGSTFTTANITRLGKFSRTSLPQMPNAFVVSYADRDNDYEPRPVRAVNPSGVRAAGREILQTADYVGVTTSLRASILATRLKRSGTASVLTGDFSAVLGVHEAVRPSTKITVHHPKEGTLLMRVLSVGYGNYDSRQEVDIEAIEDIWRDGDGSLAGTTPTPPPADSGAAPPSELEAAVAFYAPPYLTNSEQDQALVIAAPSSPDQRTFRVTMADFDDAIYAADGDSDVPGRYGFAALGALSGDTGHDAYTLTAALSAGSLAVAQRRAGASNVLVILGNPAADVGYEWAMASAVVAGSGTVAVTLSARGLFGTWPLRFAAGTPVWLVYDKALDPSYLATAVTIGTDFSEGDPAAKWAGYNFAAPWVFSSNAYRENTTPARVTPLQAAMNTLASPTRAARPYQAGLVRINASEGAYDKSDTLPALSLAGPLAVTWTNRNKKVNGTSPYDDIDGDGTAAPNTRTRVLVEHQALGASVWSEVANVVNTDGSTVAAGLVLPAEAVAGHIVRVMVRTEELIGGKWVWPAGITIFDGQLDYEAEPGRARYFVLA